MKEDGQAVTDGYLGTIEYFLIVSGLSRSGGYKLGAATRQFRMQRHDIGVPNDHYDIPTKWIQLKDYKLQLETPLVNERKCERIVESITFAGCIVK